MALERTLPRDAYFADYVWQREKERIFGREWVCAGPAEELPAPGDYLVLDWRERTCWWSAAGPASSGPSTMSAATGAVG
jgi:phenylpropionate dioxygenase-like ring-hydroxylating dioxygenase large terminal subunit